MNSPEKEKREQEIYESFFAESDHIKSLRPNPHFNTVKWSNKDDMMLNVAIRSCEQTIEDYPNDRVRFRDCIEWLKSLRPSWKPSEDEKRLINTSISFLKDFADKGYENAAECIDWLKSKLNEKSTDA